MNEWVESSGFRIEWPQPKVKKVIPKVNGHVLTQEDIGREMIFRYHHGEEVYGHLSSFRDDGAIFVRFKGPTGERCDASQLRFSIT